MNRRESLAVAGALLAMPLTFAQSQSKVYRVGVLSVDSAATAEQIAKVLTARFVELGWRSGQNLNIDFRRSDTVAGLGEQAAGLIASTPDALLAIGPYPAFTLRDATRSIPVVFAAVGNPVERGLVSSLARPGGNITGVSHLVGVGLGGKYEEILKELVPHAQRFAVLINPDHPGWRGDIRKKYQTYFGNQLGVQIDAVGARTADEVPAAIEAAVRAKAEGLVIFPDSVLDSASDRIVQLVAKHKLPAIHPYGRMVVAGGLVSYSTDMVAVMRRGADYVDRILKGASPADLPVEHPTKFELTVNLKAARGLGMKIPQSILLRADRVIE